MSEPTITIPRPTLATLCAAVEDSGSTYESNDNGPDRYVCFHCYASVKVDDGSEPTHFPDCPVHLARDVRKAYLAEAGQ